MKDIQKEITPIAADDLFIVLNHPNAKFDYPVHYHPDYEINLVMDTYGSRIVGDSVEAFEALALIMIGPNLPHAWKGEEVEGNHVITIQFSDKLLNFPILEKRLFNPIKQLLLESQRGIGFSRQTQLVMKDKIIKLTRMQGFHTVLEFFSILHELSIADRLIFMRKPEPLTISVRKNKEDYQPFDRVLLDFSVRDTAGKPVSAPISVSVRDGWEEVESRHSMLADLLLMSEIKGYVHRPLYYFEADDKEHRTALDHLLLVQGWRRYAWKYESGVEPFELKYMPEQGIEVHGQVVSFVRGKPKPNIQVSSFLAKRGDEETSPGALSLNLFETDSVGRFAFITDIIGKWNLILSVMEKGKRKDHRIVL